MSGTKIGRIEAGRLESLSITDASKIAAVLGLDLSVKLYPAGSPLRDAAHTAKLRRVLENVRPPLARRTEVPLPQRPGQPTELRAWDAVLFGAGLRTGLELEMRLRDGQAVERRLAAKRRDDPVDAFLLLIADTKTNRRVLAENASLFGDLPRLKTSTVLKVLRAGQHPATGLLLI